MLIEDLESQALAYHADPQPGKIAISITKPLNTQKALSLAYSPGVAVPAKEIAADPSKAYKYTAKGNLVGIITNGSAVLGLGNIGPLASKPVMEGKAALFKMFAGIDAIDIEIEADCPKDFIETVVRIAPTFGGINLEDIASPHCFEIEQALIKRLNIPVIHDDQHGTAITVAAGLQNALELQGKTLSQAKITCVGAGAAGIAILQLLVLLGAPKDNILLVDQQGIIHKDDPPLHAYSHQFAAQTSARTLAEAVAEADVFIGVATANLLTPQMLKTMAPNPIVFALSNPNSEIDPKLAYTTREDLILATGRSDYPNQVNNALVFPFLFRGALDVRATRINDEMKIAAVQALIKLTKDPVPQEVLNAYEEQELAFGVNYILPKIIDPRLKPVLSSAISQAAIQSGVAQKNL
ncbi:malic enzyme-like NAD(P)-binding protein [Candidatus Nitrosacidococcus tergens]|uniref:NADP-dependent malic enzyme n=1 Tax=Candidatus Nitrosacidococcus tergens TaxID=553981 RepID=A0A7G1Q7A8_9GAMM|nr:malic enzyme-like NAD(P)-binding protein [Candidatus Nitrosacidococcus tergens]CAB1274223.1 Malate dehydrogenase (Oxaloacetate-decarboxylating) (NADP(+)) [Candidatus Nitrosacidococcus tergens]